MKKVWIFTNSTVCSNIASEASYIYILSGQKFIKNAKNGQFWRVDENLENLNIVTRQVTIFE